MEVDNKKIIYGITQDDYHEILRCLAKYTKFKCDHLPNELNEIVKKKYNQAKIIENEFGETNKTIDEVIAYLNDAKEILNNIRKINESENLTTANSIIEVINNDMPDDLNNLEKTEYLFDIICNTITYAENYYKYINNLFNDFDIELNNSVPFPDNIEEFIVTKEAICDDIANTFVHLGRIFHLPIGKINLIHNENLHAINYIETEKEMTSLFDATEYIRKNKNKKECFLVDYNNLDINDDYLIDKNNNQYRQVINSTTINKETPKYNIEETIRKINDLMPSVQFEPIVGLDKVEDFKIEEKRM